MKQSQQPQQPQEEWWYKHECGIQQPELMDEDTPLLERAVAWMRRKYYAIIDHYVDKEVKHARRKFDRGRRLRFEQLEPRCMLNGMGIDAPQWDSPLTPPTGALDVFESAYYANDIAISQDQEEMAIASRDAGIHILNAKTATDIQTLSGHTANVIDTEYSADGKLLASVSYDRTLRIWDNETKCQIKSIPLASLGTAVQFSPDSQLVAAGVHETGILIHDIQTGAQVIVPYSNDCARFAFSTDSSTMAFADSGKVKLYDISSGQIVREFSGTTAAIYSLDINPSGTLVAAGDRAGTVCIWDIATGELLSSTKDHCGAPTAASGVLSVVFQKGEGKHLITADYSGLVIVKNIEESTAPVEIARYQTQGPCCVVSYPTGEAFLANNEVNGKGRGAAYPLPLTPAVPDPVTEPETPTEEPEATAVPALTKLQTLRSTLASAEGSTVGIAAQNLLQEIIITCGEQPDTTTLATFASSLEERRQLLLEADVLTTLLQEQSADATTLTMLKTSTALQRAINDHRIASLNSFLSLMEAGTATAEDCGSFLRCSTDALDLAALGSGKEWVGAIHTDSETNTRIVHVKQGTAPALQNDALPLSSTLTGIDFSQNGHLVTSARLKLTFTGTAPSVKAYRDGKVIGTYTPDAGGYVQIFDLQGITHLIVTHSASSTAILEEMTVQSDVGVPSGGSRALGAGTSREIALAMAPTAASWKAYVIKSRAGDIRIDPTKYTMVSVHGYTKNATIGSIQYYDHKYGNTTKTLPNEFITKLDAYTWIIHPGAPECLKVAVNGATIWNYGSKGYQWEYSQTVQAGQT